MLQHFCKLLNGKAKIFDDGRQGFRFEIAASMNRNDYAGTIGGASIDDMAALLPIEDKTKPLGDSNHFAGADNREFVGHETG